MRKYLLFVSILIGDICFAQQNCTTTIDAQKNSIKKCLHENGAVSTIETWDKEKRSGSLKAFDKNGKELFNYDLRTFAGHASVFLIYYKNGQVSKAEYTSAPDAGIQHFHEISRYDVDGVRTSFENLSQPDGYPRISIPDELKQEITEKQKKEEEEKRKKNPYYDKPYLCVFQIQNSSKKKVILSIKTTNTLANFKSKTITLKAKEVFVIDSMHTTSKITNSNTYYKIEIDSKTKKANQLKLIESQPQIKDNTQNVSWYVLSR